MKQKQFRKSLFSQKKSTLQKLQSKKLIKPSTETIIFNQNIKTSSNFLSCQSQSLGHIRWSIKKPLKTQNQIEDQVDKSHKNQRNSLVSATNERRLRQKTKKKYTFQIRNQGNNSALIIKLLISRGSWQKYEKNQEKLSSFQNMCNFYWGVAPKNSNFGRMTLQSRIKGAKQLTDKARLYDNIIHFCTLHKIKNQNFLPITFCFTSKSNSIQLQRDIEQFLQLFDYIKNYTNLSNTWIYKPTNLNQGRQIVLFNSLQKIYEIVKNNKKYQNDKQPSIKKEKSTQFNNSIRNSFHTGSQNIRPLTKILKRADFNNLNYDKNILKRNKNKSVLQEKTSSLLKRNSKSKQIQKKSKYGRNSYFQDNKEPNHFNAQISKVNEQNIEQKLKECLLNIGQSSREIIIQKYIQNPYLINNKKFDIRMWVLVDHYQNYYLFQEGYLRFSSYQYKINKQRSTIQNNYIHLTNHALQKYSQKYSSEDNLVRLRFLKQHIMSNFQKDGERKYQKIVSEMKRIVSISIESTLGKVFASQSNIFYNKHVKILNQFQIFGYDFLLDRELNLRLIQVNTNPSITQDCQFHKKIIPRMLNDAFKLTVDCFFSNSAQEVRNYYVQGHSDQNLWRKIGKIGQTSFSQLRQCRQ